MYFSTAMLFRTDGHSYMIFLKKVRSNLREKKNRFSNFLFIFLGRAVDVVVVVVVRLQPPPLRRQKLSHEFHCACNGIMV